MMFLIIAPLLVVAVRGQEQDPTKICLPDVLQINLTSVFHNTTGLAVFNFPKQLVTLRSTYGTRLVFNFSDETVALINELDGSCTKSQYTVYIGIVLAQCLPANSKPITNADIYLGLRPDSLEVEGWEYTVPSAGTVRNLVTKGSPSVPVIRRVILADPNSSDVEIFSDPKVTIDDPTLFTIPDICPPTTVVG